MTVTATLSAELVEWGQMPEGWTRVDNLTATYAVELTGTTCDEVTPVAPSFTQAVCRNGELVPPTLTLPTTDGITYTADKAPPFMPLPELVTVTATFDDDRGGLACQLPDGVDRDELDDGDVLGAVLRELVYSGGSGGSRCGAGDVYQR